MLEWKAIKRQANAVKIESKGRQVTGVFPIEGIVLSSHGGPNRRRNTTDCRTNTAVWEGGRVGRVKLCEIFNAVKRTEGDFYCFLQGNSGTSCIKVS